MGISTTTRPAKRGSGSSGSGPSTLDSARARVRTRPSKSDKAKLSKSLKSSSKKIEPTIIKIGSEETYYSAGESEFKNQHD
jgi:hypothetical protein